MKTIIFDPTIGKIISVIFCFILIYILSRSFNKVLNSKITDSSTRYKTKKAVSFSSFILFVFCLGFIFSDKLGGLTVAFGVTGAGIAFALQEVIASIAGWFAINFNNFFKVGDRVQLGGIKGDVIDIGVLRTTIMEMGDWVKGDLYNGRTVKISNSYVFKDPVFNYSAEYPFLWDEISISVRLESDLEETENIIKRCAAATLEEFEKNSKKEWRNLVKKYPIEDARLENLVTFHIEGGSAHFTLRYITGFKSRRRTKDLLFRSINAEFNKTAGKVEWAVSSMELSSRPSLKIELEKEKTRAIL